MSSSSRWAAFAVSVLIAGCAQPGSQPADTSADVAAINAVRDREVTLVTLGNPDSMVTIYTEDVVIMPPGEPAVEGRATAQQWAATMFGQVTISVNYTNSNVTVAGDWAIDRYSGSVSVTPKAGGAALTEQIKGIHVMRREADGSWKIAMDVWNSDAPPPPAPPAPRP